jgi:hypothetical protein
MKCNREYWAAAIFVLEEHRYVGVMGCWGIGVLGYWGIGVLGEWRGALRGRGASPKRILNASGGEKAFSHQFCSHVPMVSFFLVAQCVKQCPKDAIPSPQSPISPSPRFLIIPHSIPAFQHFTTIHEVPDLLLSFFLFFLFLF